MSRRKKDPAPPAHRRRSAGPDPAQPVPGRARRRRSPGPRMLLAVARGDDYQQAARAAGRRSGDAVSHLVARFNAEGLAALDAPPRRRPAPTYDPAAASGSSARPTRPPTPEADGTATWSLATLRKALRVGPRRPAQGLDLHHLAGAPRGRLQLPADPHLVPDRHGPAPPQGRRGGRHRPGRRRRKKVDRGRLPRSARRWACRSGAPTRPGRSRRCPIPGQSWRPEGEPARQPHEYLRDGTAKVLTLFHPADGRVRVKGVTACPNAVLHAWLEAGVGRRPGRDARRRRPSRRPGRRAAWERWQEGLTIKPTLPAELPPLRMLLVLDNLAGHKTPEFVCWLFAHGIMPLYTPVGGSWLNMAESIQRILKRRALDGQHPSDTGEIIAWFEAVAAALERGPDAVRVGREAGGPPAAAAGASPPAGRLGGLHPRAARRGGRGPVMATCNANDPLVGHLACAWP